MNSLIPKKQSKFSLKYDNLDEEKEEISLSLDKNKENDCKRMKKELHVEKKNKKNNDILNLMSSKNSKIKIDKKQKSWFNFKFENVICSFLPFTLRPGINKQN